MINIIQDKNSIVQVLSSLLKQPSLLGQASEYNIVREDFPEQFHKIIFAAINNLYHSGAEKIDVADVDGFLSNYDIQYKIFNDNNGIDYLYQIQELSKIDNFDYYYSRLKKYSFLRACKEKKIDISDIYIEDLIDPKEEEKMQEQFDAYTLEELVGIIEKKVMELKIEFKTNKSSDGIQGAEGIKEIIEELRVNPDYGLPLCSGYLNTITRGARKRKFYIRSSISGGGKSRLALADLLNICVDELYDVDKGKWISNGDKQKGLFITTELEFEEIQTPSIAFISSVPEDSILDGTLTDDESKRVERAIEIFEQTDFWIEYLPDFDLDDIEQTIEKHVIKNEVDYVVFDYIHSSVKLLSEVASKSKISNLREDQILLLMSSRLKEICNRHNIWLLSGTQLNADNMIRGSKAIMDKADFYAHILPVNAKDLDSIKPILQNGFSRKPNFVSHIQKIRRGKYNNVKVWHYINLGTLRTHDCFTTTEHYELISEIKPTEIKTTKFEF